MTFKNIILLSLILTTMTFLTINTAHAEESIDQVFTGVQSANVDLTQVFAIKQEFTPTVDSLSSVYVILGCRDAVRCTPEVTLSIQDMVTHELKTVTQQLNLNLDGRPYVKVQFILDEPIQLVPLTLHGFTVSAGPNNRDAVLIYGSNDRNSYPAGDGYVSTCSVKGCSVTTFGDFGFITLYEHIQTPEEQTQDIVDDVLDLLTSGNISTQSANSLTSTLENAIDKIEDGNTTSATGMLGAFINKVEQMIQTGKISPENGQALIDAANSVINSL